MCRALHGPCLLLATVLLLLPPGVLLVPSSARRFQFAFALEGRLWDYGWAFNANLARIALQNALSQRHPDIPISHAFALLPASSLGVCDPQFEAWCQSGVDLIITTALSQVPCVTRLAPKYPNVTFLSVGGDPVGPPNYFSLGIRLYQPSYLAGYTAGLMTRSKKVCICAKASAFYPGLRQDVWGFSYGVRAADPTAQVHVFGAGLDPTPLTSIWIVNQSSALGCDVIWLLVDMVDPFAQADALRMMSIGQFTDARKTVGESIITSVMVNLAPALLRATEAVLNGTLRNETRRADWWMGWDWGAMSLADFSFLVPPAIQSRVAAQVPALDRIFCGRACNGMNCPCSNSTCCLSDAQLMSLSAYPDIALDHGTVQLPGLACGAGQLATWRLDIFTMQCSACPAGTYAYNQDAVSQCLPCPAAMFSQPGATVCTACPAGTYNDQPGQGQCPICPMGSIAPNTGSIRCSMCSSGLSSSDGTECAAPSTAWMYGLGGGIVGGFILLGVFLLVVVRRHSRRNNAAAPKDPAQPFCIVFTDIQSSTTLWAMIPDVMARALDTHHTMIRRLIARHKCYEVKTIGDSFMCATKSPAQALHFALALQEEFARHDWGTERIDGVYLGMGTPETSTPGCWNGLRVRAGIHFGSGDIKLDPVSKGYDYYGTVVNTAARIESVCHGGQTGVSEAVVQALGGYFPGAVLTDLGPQPLRGLSEPIRLYQVLPEGPLSQRRFPPLRIDHEDAKEAVLAEAAHDVSQALPAPSGSRYRPSVVPTTGTESVLNLNLKWAETHPLVCSGYITAEDLQRQYHTVQAGLATLLTPLARAIKQEALKELCAHLHVANHGTEGPQLHRTLHGLVHRVLPAAILHQAERRDPQAPPHPQFPGRSATTNSTYSLNP